MHAVADVPLRADVDSSGPAPAGRAASDAALLESLLSGLGCGWSWAPVNRRVASWQKSDQPLPGARRWHRIPLRTPLLLTPLDHKTGEPCGSPLVVQGRDISFSGIAFTHTAPLPYGRVALTLDREDGRRDTFQVRLVWCRFTKAGVYQSGGRFLRAGGTEGVRDRRME